MKNLSTTADDAQENQPSSDRNGSKNLTNSDNNAKENIPTDDKIAGENLTPSGNDARENPTTTETAIPIVIKGSAFGIIFVFFLAFLILHKRKMKKKGKSVGFRFP